MRASILLGALLAAAVASPEIFRACAAAPVDTGVVEVGFAETDITPKIGGGTPVYMAGFGQNRKATAVHDPLKARAVVLREGERKLALVSVDLVGYSLPQVVAVRRQLPGFTYVLVSSTHNHEGSDTMGLWGATAFQSGVDPER